MTLVASRPRIPEPTLPAGAYRMFTDERLAKLAANGNRAAFEAIYARYHDTLFRYCRSLVREDEDARDALQNTMLNAMAAMHRRDRNAPLRPWLFRIAHNESISLLRRRRPSDSLDDDSEPHRELADGRADVHESAVTNEKLDQLLEDLGELTERQRGALLMRELGGLGYNEIAAALDTSEPAVRQSVFAARSALHESAEGRDLSCSSVQSSISAGDRRSIRGRRVSAHLRACPTCRDFSAGIRTRRAHFGLLGPAPALAASMLQSILGAGGGAAAGGAAGMTAAGGSAAAGSVAAKALVALAAVGAAAGGTVEITEHPLHPAKAQTAAVHRSTAKSVSAPASLAPARVKVRAHPAPVKHRRAPVAVVRRQSAKAAPVSYHWRGAHKDPSGAHPGTAADPFSPKYRTLVRQDQSLQGLLAHTNASMLAARMIEQWKAQQRARIVAELQAQIQAQQQAAAQQTQPAEPAPAPAASQPAAESPASSDPGSEPAPAESAPASDPAPAADPAPADTASQDGDDGSSADTSAQ